MQPETKYRFYATLLDAFQNYLDSEKIWEKYWGWSENPPYSPEEFAKKQFQGLIERINRTALPTEAAERGTAFNEIVDCLVTGRAPEKMEIFELREVGGEVISYNGRLNGREYSFDGGLCRRFAGIFSGGLPQQFVSASLDTGPGRVELYGYMDYLMPQSVHDLKTTSRYSVGKYKSGWQHLVYPYCLRQQGMRIDLFEYDIAELDSQGRWQAYVETYSFDPERDVPRLKGICEQLIRFVEENRALITDKKIFAQWESSKRAIENIF